jgi:hypothetical protein
MSVHSCNLSDLLGWTVHIQFPVGVEIFTFATVCGPILEPIKPPKMIWDSSVGIVTGFGLNDWGLILNKGRSFYVGHHVQTSSGAHETSYRVG